MRFNKAIYDKVFPRQDEPVVVESAVSTFTPTTDKLNVEEQTSVEEVVEEVVEVENSLVD